MARFRDSHPAGQWSLYLILLSKHDPGVEGGWIIDPELRSGAVVLVDPLLRGTGESLHAVGHEIGHLLNLGHPWERGEDSPGLMSYPWRWLDWDWADAASYGLDAEALQHIGGAPEHIVKPGSGPFIGMTASQEIENADRPRTAESRQQ
jgi:hypothetical protein